MRAVANSAAVRRVTPFIEPTIVRRTIPRTHPEHTLRVTAGGEVGRNGFPAEFRTGAMVVSRSPVDLHAPPAEFDEMIDWLERWSYSLVLLEEYPIPDLRSAVSEVTRAFARHRVTSDPWLTSLRLEDEEMARGVRVILHDHEWFVGSLEQLDGYLRVVEAENHGGHRQALGQYGRVLAEAMRRHRREERELEQKHRGTPRDRPASAEKH